MMSLWRRGSGDLSERDDGVSSSVGISVRSVGSASDSPSPPRTPATPSDAAFIVPWKSVSFSCGGWLQFYLFGVARAMQAAGVDQGVEFCGCSAGALAAAGLAMDGDFDAAIEFCKSECIPKAHGHVSGLFKIADYVSKCIDLLLVPKFCKLPPGRLQVAITQLPFFSGLRVTTHESMQDLKETLLASSAAFPAAPLVDHWRFGRCVDGGLSDFQPIVDADTITVSPFYFSDCDIKPSRYVPPWWAALPPKSADTVDWVYNLGFDDAQAWLAAKGIGPSTSPHARPHLSEFRRAKRHPYDTPRRINYHRFLGYDLLNVLPSQVLSFVLDLGLLLVLLLLWRPLALALVYVELLLQLVMSLFLLLLREVSSLVLTPLDFLQLAGGEGQVDASKASRAKAAGDVHACLSCLFSLSLLLRFFSSFERPSSADLRKHDKLYYCSVLYRIVRHIV